MAQLKEFGVTTYAARAYITLLSLGVADARAVSEHSSIPSAKVYGALVQLQRRGLVEVTPGKPRKYVPVPIAAFVERQLKEQEARIADLRGRVAEITTMFPTGVRVEPADRPQTVTIEGKRNIMQHLREACQGATASVYALVSPLLRGDLAIRRPFEEAARRGVEVRLIEDVPVAELAPSLHPPLREPDGSAPHLASASLIATFDERKALLFHLRRSPQKEGPSSGAILTTDAGFVQPLHRLLLHRRALVPATVASASGGDARLDAATFDRMLLEHARMGAREACAILHAAEASELERDQLWKAARAAQRTRVLLSPTSPRPADPSIIASFPPEAEVKFLPRASAVAFTILDGHRAFFVSPSRPARDRVDDALYAFTSDAAIVRAFEAQFEANWAMGVPLVRAR